MEKGFLPVAFITDDPYVIPTGAAIQSMIESKRPDTCYEIFLITTGVSPENRQRFQRFNSDTVRVNFMEVDEDHREFDEEGYYVSSAGLLKFDIAELIPDHDRILYLDGDVLVRKDLSELFEVNLENRLAAAVKDMAAVVTAKFHEKLKLRDYFNSGVLLLNARAIRKEGLKRRLYATKREHPEYECMDQDVFNDVFRKRVLFLNLKYNVMAFNFRIAGYTVDQINDFYGCEYLDADQVVRDAVIIHLTNEQKPWWYYYAFMAEDWRSVWKRSPWRRARLVYRDRCSYLNGTVKELPLPGSRKVWQGRECRLYVLRVPVAKRVELEGRKRYALFGVPAFSKVWDGSHEAGTLVVRFKAGPLTLVKRAYKPYDVDTCLLGIRISRKPNLRRLECLAYRMKDETVAALRNGRGTEEREAQELRRQLMRLESYKLLRAMEKRSIREEIRSTTPAEKGPDFGDIKGLLPYSEYLSFSQMGQDRLIVFLIRYFTTLSLSDLRYLDIGSADPVGHNNTFLLYCAGARGVLADPNEAYREKTAKIRPEDVFLNCGVGYDESRERTYYDFGEEGRGHNTFDGGEAEESAKLFRLEKEEVKPLIPINELIEAHFPEAGPDVVSIDTEGYDALLLKALDWSRYKPLIICAEDRSGELTEYMREKGYRVCAHSVVDNLFIHVARVEKNEDLI